MERRPETPLSTLVASLENNPALDAAVAAVKPLGATVAANETVLHALQGKWLGHAIHPLIVTVPIGAWIAAIGLDLSGVDEDGRSAQFLTGLGVAAAAIPAAHTGIAELVAAGQREKRVGVVHAGVMLGAVAVQLASWLSRRQGRPDAGRTLSLVGAALAGLGGYFGGHLSIARKVGTRDRYFAETDAESPAPEYPSRAGVAPTS